MIAGAAGFSFFARHHYVQKHQIRDFTFKSIQGSLPSPVPMPLRAASIPGPLLYNSHGRKAHGEQSATTQEIVSNVA
ncbi:hypothetical protein [Desulfobacter sp.]|uniref:hypothetical protein n=1 Tax=Desulfobacter sp. TaxID=2294 RepID=UPI003D11ACD7